eukprot:308520_1
MCSNYETILIVLAIILPVLQIVLLVSYLEINPGVEECEPPAGLPTVSCAQVPQYTCPEPEYVYMDFIYTTTATVELEPFYYGLAIYLGTLCCYSYALLIVWRFNLIRYNLQNTTTTASPWDNHSTIRNCWKLARFLGVVWAILTPCGTVYYGGPYTSGHAWISLLFGFPFFIIYPCCHSCFTTIEARSTSSNVCKWILVLIFTVLTLLSSLSAILLSTGVKYEWSLLFFSLIQFPFYSCYLGNWFGVANLRTVSDDNERENTEMTTTI